MIKCFWHLSDFPSIYSQKARGEMWFEFSFMAKLGLLGLTWGIPGYLGVVSGDSTVCGDNRIQQWWDFIELTLQSYYFLRETNLYTPEFTCNSGKLRLVAHGPVQGQFTFALGIQDQISLPVFSTLSGSKRDLIQAGGREVNPFPAYCGGEASALYKLIFLLLQVELQLWVWKYMKIWWWSPGEWTLGMRGFL